MLLVSAILFSVGANIYTLVFLKNPNKAGGDQHQWNSINGLTVNVTDLHNASGTLAECVRCVNGTLTTGNIIVNGTLLAPNTTAGAGRSYDVSSTLLQAWLQLQQVTQTVVELVVNVTALTNEFAALNATVQQNLSVSCCGWRSTRSWCSWIQCPIPPPSSIPRRGSTDLSTIQRVSLI